MSWLEALDPQAKIGFSNAPYLEVAYWPFPRGNEQVGIHSIVKIQDGALAVALDHETHEVYVIRQIRKTEQGSLSVIEVPGGAVDEGASPLETVRRELLEEAGVEAEHEDDWVMLSPPDGFHPIDGRVITNQHVFLLLSGRKVENLVDSEILDVTSMPLSELIAMDVRNEFHDPMVGYALRRAHDWLQANRPELLT